MNGRGWQIIGSHADIAAWADAARPLASAAIAADSGAWRCGGTWHVGLEALPNGADGALSGVAFPWEALALAPMELHAGQVSVIRPGYPQPWAGESEAGFAYRLRRDAAHIDGILAVGAEKRRFLREPHAWILGIALNDHSAAASPLTMWEGSHRVMGEALCAAVAGHAREAWGDVDVTEAYQAARRAVFATCRRITLPLARGEAVLLHRHALHGMAAWQAGAMAPAEGRMIAYFRPVLPSVAAWLDK